MNLVKDDTYDYELDDQVDQYYDDISGAWLDRQGVLEARQESMKVFAEHGDYTHVPMPSASVSQAKNPSDPSGSTSTRAMNKSPGTSQGYWRRKSKRSAR